MIRRINIFGGPCLPKPDFAQTIYKHLEGRDINCEKLFGVCITNAGLGWHLFETFSQGLLVEKLYHDLGKTIIVTMPLLELCCEADRKISHEMVKIAQQFDAEFPPINVLLKRTIDYRDRKRWERADDYFSRVDRRIEAMLTQCACHFTKIDPNNKQDVATYLELLDSLQGPLPV